MLVFIACCTDVCDAKFICVASVHDLMNEDVCGVCFSHTHRDVIMSTSPLPQEKVSSYLPPVDSTPTGSPSVFSPTNWVPHSTCKVLPQEVQLIAYVTYVALYDAFECMPIMIHTDYLMAYS